MLLGATFVVALVRDGRDDARLIVVPAEDLDPSQPRELRARPVGRHRKPCAKRLAVRQGQFADVPARPPALHRSREARDAQPFADVGERARHVVVEGHMGERLAFLRIEMEMGEAHRVAHAPVHDFHGEDRLRLRLDRVPRPDLDQEPARSLGDGDSPKRRQRRRAPKRRIDERHRNAAAEGLLDSGGEREPARARAGDDDVENRGGCGHLASRLLGAHCRPFAAGAQSNGRRVTPSREGAQTRGRGRPSGPPCLRARR